MIANIACLPNGDCLYHDNLSCSLVYRVVSYVHCRLTWDLSKLV